MNSDLLRQRRNLILTCTALLIFDFANVSIAKISIMGTELVVGNAKTALYFAWLMWAYFLLRYYQYLRVEGELGLTKTARSQFEGRSIRYVLHVLNKRSHSGGITFHRRGLQWCYDVSEYQPKTDISLTASTGSLPTLKAYWWWIQGYFYLVMHTPKATDHVLPFILAIAVPTLAVLRVLGAI